MALRRAFHALVAASLLFTGALTILRGMKYIFAMLVLFETFPAIADVVTFETAPNGSLPIDDSSLSTPYNITGGTVRFFYDINGNNRYDSGVDILPDF